MKNLEYYFENLEPERQAKILARAKEIHDEYLIVSRRLAIDEEYNTQFKYGINQRLRWKVPGGYKEGATLNRYAGTPHTYHLQDAHYWQFTINEDELFLPEELP